MSTERKLIATIVIMTIAEVIEHLINFVNIDIIMIMCIHNIYCWYEKIPDFFYLVCISYVSKGCVFRDKVKNERGEGQ